jgi:PmbA protein
MMDRKDIESRVSRAFDGYELFFLKERGRKYESKDKEVYGVEFKEEEGLALRAVKDGRMVFAYTYEKGAEAGEALLANATALLPFMEKDEAASFPEKHDAYPPLSLFDEKGLALDHGEKTALLFEMERSMLDYDGRIVATRNCELHETEVWVEIVNSNGLSVAARKTLYSLSALCVAKDRDEVSWYDWSWGNAFGGLDGKGLGTEIARKAVSFLGSEQISTGKYPGILTPQAACEILAVLSDSFLSESLYKNKTKLKDRVGEKCFSEVLTIIDSGTAGIDAFSFDGEGVPSQENIVVKGGHFMGFLYNTYYGGKFGKPSTGNEVRSGLKAPPLCGCRGLFVEKGNRDIAGILTDGVIIEELMGTHTANAITGDFSLGAVGYLVRRGIKTPFKGVIFSGNILELFSNVKEVGNDPRFYGTTGSPSLYIEGMKISGI